VESKWLPENPVIFMDLCEEKEGPEVAFERLIRNKYFGIRTGGLSKMEMERLKSNLKSK